MISVFIFTSNDFQPWKIEEREREIARKSLTSEQEDRIGARWSHRSDCSNPPSLKPVTDHRDRLAIFEPRAKRETERERRGSREIIAPPARSSRHFQTTRKGRDRESREIVAPTNPLASRTHSHRFILVLVWNFCNKICLWFWFFTFSIWSLIFLLLLWWHGWWCFGGFPVMWWWVLWGWWWKIAFFRMLPNTWNYFLEKFS